MTARRIALLAILCLAGCATTDRLAAARDAHALMVAVRDDDRRAFDARVDRPALEARLQAVVVEKTRRAGLAPEWTAAGLIASGPVSRWAGEVLIRPEVFRAVADYYGYRPGAPLPGVVALASVLHSLPGGRMCAAQRPRSGDCLLTFTDENGTWKLSDFAPAALHRGAP